MRRGETKGGKGKDERRNEDNNLEEGHDEDKERRDKR